MNRLAAELGDPARDAERDVYLVTVSRVLPDALDQTDLADVEATSSEGVGRALLSALNGSGGGVVKEMAAFKSRGWILRGRARPRRAATSLARRWTPCAGPGRGASMAGGISPRARACMAPGTIKALSHFRRLKDRRQACP